MKMHLEMSDNAYSLVMKSIDSLHFDIEEIHGFKATAGIYISVSSAWLIHCTSHGIC